MSRMTAAEFAKTIDHTILKPEALAPDVQKICAEALEYRFASVCVAGAWIPQVAASLKGSGVLTCTVVGFPHGTSKATVKAIEAVAAVKDGAQEVDVVIHLPHLLALDLDAARAELIEVVRGVRAARRETVVKVIVESAALLSVLGDEKGEQAIEVACKAVRESGSDFIKTSTGFHPAGGASVKAVSLMKKYGQGIKVKASGGIRDLATARAMLDAGADRLGLSASVAIMKEMQGGAPAAKPASGY
jgi:deoxyribose-phosphate aldolase